MPFTSLRFLYLFRSRMVFCMHIIASAPEPNHFKFTGLFVSLERTCRISSILWCQTYWFQVQITAIVWCPYSPSVWCKYFLHFILFLLIFFSCLSHSLPPSFFGYSDLCVYRQFCCCLLASKLLYIGIRSTLRLHAIAFTCFWCIKCKKRRQITKTI